MERVLRWETPYRYYAARLHRDLLGDWILECAWGGKQNNLGGSDTTALACEADGHKAITDLHIRRLAHRYDLVEDSRRP